MKIRKSLAFLLTLAVPAAALAQPPEGDRPRDGRQGGRPGFFGGREGGREGFRMPNPLLEALDADRNGELSKEEIENAVVALKTLDKNSDGKLDGAEIRPNFEGMGRGFGEGGPGGGGGNPQEMVDRMMAMDANKDGKLSKDEIPERLQSMLTRSDKNSDGSLDKDEILATSRERMGGPGAPGFGGPGGPGFGGGNPLAQILERSDSDKDGKLSADEAPDFLKDRFAQIDTNSDSFLDKAELEAAAERMRGRGPGRGEGGRGEGGRGQRPPVEEEPKKAE